MRRIIAAVGLFSAVAAAWPLVLEPSAAGPRSGPTFVIPASDGYGVGECPKDDDTCGRSLADGWCAANGFARAAAFDPAQLQEAGATPAPRRATTLTVTCEN